ncbi:MAG: TasA family protein [Thermoleophilia bacterium]
MLKKSTTKLAMSILLIVVAAVTLVGFGTFAYFSDSENSTDNVFTAGTLEVTLGASSWSAGFDNMAPGDTVILPLTLESIGSLPLDYTITTEVSGELSSCHTGYSAYVSAVRVDGADYSVPESLSASSAHGGLDPSDNIEVDITLPAGAGNSCQSKSGTLNVTVTADQQT